MAGCLLLAGDPALAGYGKFVLTGPPGCGKTTILKELRARGFLTVDEAYTELYRRAAAEGALAAFLAEPAALHRSLGRHQLGLEAALPIGEPVFLDRGIIDICHFAQLKQLPGLEHAAQEPAARRYDLVFYVEPLPEQLFQRTEIRALSYAQAQQENAQLIAHYQRHGYRANLVTVPFGAPALRAEFILNTVRERFRFADVIDRFAGVPAGKLNALAAPFPAGAGSGPVRWLETPLNGSARSFRFFGVHQGDHGQIDVPDFKRRIATVLDQPAPRMLALAGDSRPFAPEAAHWLRTTLWQELDAAGAILCGYAGHPDSAPLDVNSLVNSYVDQDPRRAGKVLATLTGETHAALLKSGAPASAHVRTFIVVYTSEGMTAAPAYDRSGRRTSGYTTMGEGMRVSGNLLRAADGDKLVCLEGDVHAFLLVLEALRNDVPVDLMHGLRGPEHTSGFSAAGLLLAVRNTFLGDLPPAPAQVRRAVMEYAATAPGHHPPGAGPWVEGKEVQHALEEFIEGGLYRKLATHAVFLAGQQRP